jgi:hypothetical protein
MDPSGWERVGKGVDSSENHMVQRGGPLMVWTNTSSETWIGMVGILGYGQSGLLGQATAMDSMVCSMSRFEEKRC